MKKEELAYLFAIMQVVEENNGKVIIDDLEAKVNKYKPMYDKYVETQGDQLQNAVKIYKMYDKSGKLNKLWENLNSKKFVADENTLNILTEYALNVYEGGVLNDAYPMFNFIAALYPQNYRVYIYLGESIEALYGIENALIFYKAVTSIFVEPELFFCAARCSIKASNWIDAGNYINKALSTLENQESLEENEQTLKDGLLELSAMVEIMAKAA